MFSMLQEFFDSLQSGFLKKVLLGAGVMLGVDTTLMMAFNSAVNSLENTVHGVGSSIIALAHLSGFDVAISMILSAISTRIFLKQLQVSIMRI